MEISYDWRSFQTVFSPRRKAAIDSNEPIYVVADAETVIAAFSQAEDLSDWIGAPYQKMAGEFANREFVVFDRGKVDQLVQGSVGLSHFYDQIENVRKEAMPEVFTKNRSKKMSARDISARHFLLDALEGWWAKVLPSAFGLLIRLETTTEGAKERNFFVVFRRGRVESFHEADLNAISPERRSEPAQVVKYLSEKYLVPVQGIFVSAKDWARWSQSSEPWREIAVALKHNEMKMVPFRWSVATLLATRAFIGV